MKINFVKSQDESTVESQVFVRAVTKEDSLAIEISSDPQFSEDSGTYCIASLDTEDVSGEGKLNLKLFGGFEGSDFEEFVALDYESGDYIAVNKE